MREEKNLQQSTIAAQIDEICVHVTILKQGSYNFYNTFFFLFRILSFIMFCCVFNIGIDIHGDYFICKYILSVQYQFKIGCLGSNLDDTRNKEELFHKIRLQIIHNLQQSNRCLLDSELISLGVQQGSLLEGQFTMDLFGHIFGPVSPKFEKTFLQNLNWPQKNRINFVCFQNLHQPSY